MPQTAIKGQVLVDFVAEFTEDIIGEEERALGVMNTSAICVLPWEVYTNKTTKCKGVGIEIMLITLEKLIMEKSLRLGFLATNNEAKYKAMLAGVTMVSQLGGDVVEVYLDSWFVVGQVNGEFEALDERMQGYLAKVQYAQAQFRSFVLK